MLYNIRDILLTLHLHDGNEEWDTSTRVATYIKEYNIIHMITSLALDNDVANVWILTVVKCGNNAQSLCECFFQGVWNRLANKIRYMHLLKKDAHTVSVVNELEDRRQDGY